MTEYLEIFGQTVDGRRIARTSWAGTKYVELYSPEQGDPYLRLVDDVTGLQLPWTQEQIDIDTAPEVVDWIAFDPPGGG